MSAVIRPSVSKGRPSLKNLRKSSSSEISPFSNSTQAVGCLASSNCSNLCGGWLSDNWYIEGVLINRSNTLLGIPFGRMQALFGKMDLWLLYPWYRIKELVCEPKKTSYALRFVIWSWTNGVRVGNTYARIYVDCSKSSWLINCDIWWWTMVDREVAFLFWILKTFQNF